MDFDDIKTTSLWRTAFEISGQPLEDQARIRLLGEFDGFRSRTNDLVSGIRTALPDLTIHDTTHLDALWRVASLLAGNGYPINPLEAFVLGGAILLHDSALCIEAYEGGRPGIRGTKTWNDSLVLEQERSPDTPLESIKSSCDFLTMRALHAERAGELAQYAWKNVNDGSDIFLITNPTLRNHVGGLIGRIASSHHWSIEEVRENLTHPLNPPTGYPSHWQIDAIKIACLLRTADAAHFCQDRAPDFLHALRRRMGVSGFHWTAQNKITGPALFAADSTGQTITYTSTQDFKEVDSKAWWIAFDAISIIQNEIVDANELLSQRNLRDSPKFAVEKVAGCNSIRQLSEFIKPSGWEPSTASIHISNIESLVRSLGGEKLYGVTTYEQKLYVVIRELIQNARDSISALRSIESDFKGEITVRYIKDGVDQYLQIEDNGIGMSSKVLTGPFLDFGNSFWSSDLVKTELPGLRATGYKSVGKFGIGFYSTFMIAAKVAVSSKRWSDGDNDVIQLLFPDGLSLRPTVKRGRPEHHHRLCSTVVRIKIHDDCKIPDIKAIKVPSGRGGIPDFTAPLGDLVASWIVGIDVPVKYIAENEPPRQIHEGAGNSSSAKDLLQQLSLCNFRGVFRPLIQKNIETHAERMRPVGDLKYGFAAIQCNVDAGSNASGVRSVGGFAPNTINGDHKFLGYIECEPDSARRGSGKYLAPDQVIADWATEQVELFEASSPDDLQRAIFGSALTDFGVDPINIVRVLAHLPNGRFLFSISELAGAAQSIPIIFAESAYDSSMDAYAQMSPIQNSIVIQPLTHGKFSSLARDNENPKEQYSILGCLNRAIKNNGLKMHIESSSATFSSLTGPTKTISVLALKI